MTRPAPPAWILLRERTVLPPGAPVALGAVADLHGPEDAVGRAAAAPLGQAPAAGGHRLLAVPEALAAAQAAAPEVDWRVASDRAAVVEAPASRRGRLWLGVLAWLLLFVGAATTLLDFHADVNMPAAHRELYFLATGRHSAHPLVVEVPYAIGLGLGALLFFLAPGAGRGEPGPLELELWRYERVLRSFWRERGPGR